MTTCDGQGRFRVAGHAQEPADHSLNVVAEDQPYVKVDKPVGDPKGFGPVRADVELRRGVWVEGRVIDTIERTSRSRRSSTTWRSATILM